MRGPYDNRTKTKIDKGNERKEGNNENNKVSIDTTYQARRSLDLQNVVPSENITNVLSTETVSPDQNHNSNEESTTLVSFDTDAQDATKVDDENKDAGINID